ncbi:MAG: hypothetical protein IMF19_13865, partial [Proteobacteria bacterium]|nr:hypothetical protein [Pseudomonadota bacterium]
MALEGGREEFDARLAEFMPEVKEKAEYVYHGTGEGAFRQIRKVGMKKAENYFSGDEQYAKTYAERKGVLKEPRILRIKKTADIIPDERIEEPGDFKTERGISPQEIEVKVGKKWIPIQEYYDESINIMPIEKPEAAPKPEKEPISETKTRLIENIKSEKGSSELINDLSRLGADVMRRGYVKFKDFSAEMQRVLGEAWSKARSLMQKAFFGAKKILESEKGAVELRNPLAGQVTDESPSGMSLFDDLEVERTYAQKINTERDEAVYQVSRRAAALEKQLKQLTGTGKRKGVVGRGISAEKIKYSEFQARKLSRAMLYYREAQINPEKAEKFEGWAVEELKTARGERKIRIKAQLESYRQSQDLTDEQKRFVDETMDQAFSEVSEEAINSGIITRAKENYVR